jgi:hypothetical protein
LVGDFEFSGNGAVTTQTGSGSTWLRATVDAPSALGGFCCSSTNGGLIVELDSPAEANYDLFVYGSANDACSGPLAQSSNVAGETDQAENTWSGSTTCICTTTGRTVAVEVRFIDGDCTAEWTLRANST